MAVPQSQRCSTRDVHIFDLSPTTIMDDFDSERRTTKRRRIDSISRSESRYSSPDELAAPSDHEARYRRRRSSTFQKELGEYRKQSYHGDTSDDSPDELDHTAHTFYRQKGRRHTISNSSSGRSQSLVSARSRFTPEEKSRYTPYRQKLVLRGHRKGVAAVKFSPDGRCIASCCKLLPPSIQISRLIETFFSG